MAGATSEVHRWERTAGEPVHAHATLMAVFAAAIAVADFALLGVATHKLSRMVALDRVTTPLRAPFIQDAESVGAGEVEAEPKGQGWQRALGELLTCPYCLAPWMAGAFMLGLMHGPGQTRVIAGVLNIVALSDFLNQRYARLKDVVQKG